MKYFLIIITGSVLFNNVLIADAVNEPLEKIKQTNSQSLGDAVAHEDMRIVSEKKDDSINTVIITFTFLLGALTVMATLFGIFMGYTWWKSSKEYENEIRRAEAAANRAESAARQAEGAIGEIRTKGDKAIKDIVGELQNARDRELTSGLKYTTKTVKNLQASLEESQKSYEIIQDTKVYQKLEELRKKAIESLKKNDTKSALRWLRESFALNRDDFRVLGSLSIILIILGHFEEALGVISTAIQKKPEYGEAYFWRVKARLLWQKNGGPSPSKDLIENDIRMARELGYIPDHEDRTLLADFLNDEEYKKLMGVSKERDKERKGETFLAREKKRQILDIAVTKLEANDLKGALGLIEASTILSEDTSGLWLSWAFILEALGRYEEALEKASISIIKDPESGRSYFIRACIRLKWYRNGGPCPHKDEIISDIKAAAKYGYGPAKYDKDDKAALTNFFSKVEYDKLICDLNKKP